MISQIIIGCGIAIISALVVWLFKLRHDDRKEVEGKLIQGQINDALFEQKLKDFKEYRQEKDSDFSDILKEIKTGLAELVTEVNNLKLEIAGLNK